MNNELKKYTSNDATHKLKCIFSYNLTSQKVYYMKCIPLKEMPDGVRIKVLVFGRLYWGGEQKRIRYVEKIE